MTIGTPLAGVGRLPPATGFVTTDLIAPGWVDERGRVGPLAGGVALPPAASATGTPNGGVLRGVTGTPAGGVFRAAVADDGVDAAVVGAVDGVDAAGLPTGTPSAGVLRGGAPAGAAAGERCGAVADDVGAAAAGDTVGTAWLDPRASGCAPPGLAPPSVFVSGGDEAVPDDDADAAAAEPDGEDDVGGRVDADPTAIVGAGDGVLVSALVVSSTEPSLGTPSAPGSPLKSFVKIPIARSGPPTTVERRSR